MLIERLSVLSLLWAVVFASVKILSKDEHGSVFEIGDKRLYYVASSPAQRLQASGATGNIPLGYVPATSIRTQFSPITGAYLESQMTLYGQVDDVWSEKFKKILIISYDGTATAFLDDDAKAWVDSNKFSTLFLSSSIRAPRLKKTEVLQLSDGPRPGPFLISSTSQMLSMYTVYRLHKDDYEAFLFGAIPIPGGHGRWLQTNITLPSDSRKVQYIPIPSRLSFLAGARSLSGTRFALKDIFDAQGLPTGAGSLAYARVHSVPTTTAPAIQKLFDLGAALIGKTRTSQFAHGASPWEFSDVPYSWNPRGDGYLTAASSSSGSACAVAGYEWVDFAVGSDTRGSVRKPAALVGAYGIRPTRGTADLRAGVVPLSEEMDTVGFFARDPILFGEITKVWFGDSPVVVKRPAIRFPKKLYYPTEHFPVANPDAQALYDTFVDALQKHLSITKVPLNFTEALLPHFPNGSFSDFHLSSNRLAEYRSWTSVGKPLIELYEAEVGGHPKFDPLSERMFARGKDITEEDFAKAVAAKRKFSASIAEDLLKADKKSCSDSLFMYDAGAGGRPSYRVEDFNALSGAAQLPLTASIAGTKASDYFTFLASMADLPEVTLPIGQVSYYSQVSMDWEMLPVAVQLVAHPGCDGMLMDLVKKLAGAGVLSMTKVGKTAF